ncbi:early activation antigen CD69 isoform X1 [Acanthopagrus latus]|uniref:early activation antigen CD69 isoform X1 n=1 Tax=Acanthopagrus latus TaxID=8177 RepID=UPI00187CE0B1|nr:early activation antigen CD69 isoform X1 [Acanthopagrus latus]
MEMHEISAEGEKIEDVEASEPTPEAKTEEEAEPDHYSKLQSPSDDIYSEAYYGGAPMKDKAEKPAEGNTRLYRAVCLLLAVICLILLLVVIVLSLKLQTGSTDCPQLVEDTCSYERCQAFFPSVQTHNPAPQRRCQQCADGWLTFGHSCFFLSTFRLNWNESQRNCSDRGGSLAVINSQSLQQFLTKEGKMQYWIGLRQNSNRWTWVNNTVLQQSYWAGVRSKGDCGVLGSDSPAERNWFTAPCHTYTYFICQLQM